MIAFGNFCKLLYYCFKWNVDCHGVAGSEQMINTMSEVGLR